MGIQRAVVRRARTQSTHLSGALRATTTNKNDIPPAPQFLPPAKGKAQVGKMDAILTDSHLDTRIKICVMINVIVPKLEYAGEVWQGNAKFVKQLETAQMTAPKKMLGCSSSSSDTV